LIIKRRRGVIIVPTKKGILVVSEKKGVYMLPGGGARKKESRKEAAIRELHEETGLEVKEIFHLFGYLGKKWNEKDVRNNTKVFLAKTKGKPKPSNEIKKISFWKPGSSLNLTDGAKKSIEKYLKDYKKI